MNADVQRQHIKNQINDTIKRYEEERCHEKQQQQRQKHLIKQQILQQLLNRQKSSSAAALPVHQEPKKPQEEFSYSFGNRQSNGEIVPDSGIVDDGQPSGNSSARDDGEYQVMANKFGKHSPGVLTFGVNRPQIEKQEDSGNMGNSSYASQSEHSQEDIYDDYRGYDNSSGHQSQRQEEYVPARNPVFTKPSSHQNIPSGAISNSSQKSIPSDHGVPKSPPLPKKDNILNLFPNQQFKPKPKSPVKKLPQIRQPSPNRVVGGIYNTSDSRKSENRNSNQYYQNDSQKYSQKSLNHFQEENESRYQESYNHNEGNSIRYTVQTTSKKDLHRDAGSERLLPNIQKSPQKKQVEIPPLRGVNEGPVPLETKIPYNAFIHDDKDDEIIEQLRKKKIQELEKKRQQRTDPNRKKSLDEKSMTKDASIHQQAQPLQHTQPTVSKNPTPPKHPPHSQHLQVPQQPSSYAAIHQKRPDRMTKDEDSETKSNNTIASYKSLNKPTCASQAKKVVRPQSKDQNARGELANTFFPLKKDVSPSQTPKTITTNKTTKTSQKNIFQDTSPAGQREKSSNKFLQRPQIQPKERKQTFSKQSNKKLMINALTNVCLPGEINRKQRQKLVEVINNDPNQFFILLFREQSRKIVKGIYCYINNTNQIQKIYGDKAPAEISAQNVTEFYRYDSGAREFKPMQACKSFSYVVHGVFIK